MTSSKILPISNSELIKIIDGNGIGVDYDSEFPRAETESILWQGSANAYVRVKNVRIYGNDTVTNIKEITVLIPWLVDLAAGSILKVIQSENTKNYKVNDIQEIAQDIGVGSEYLRCYVNEVLIIEEED